MNTSQSTLPLQTIRTPWEGAQNLDLPLSTTALVAAVLLLCGNAENAGQLPAAKAPSQEAPTGDDLALSEVVSRLEERLGTADKDQAYRLGKLVTELARRHHISSAMILAVIETESGFRFDVVSKAGAVGLMQIRPRTAEEIARRHRIASYKDAKSLADPAVNLRIGVAYLASLQRRFGHSSHYLAAYNVGPSAFQKRLRAGRSDLGSLALYVGQVHRRARVLQARQEQRRQLFRRPAWNRVAAF